MSSEWILTLLRWAGIVWLLTMGCLLRSAEFQADLYRWITG